MVVRRAAPNDDLLQSLGFTALEAAVYRELVGHSPATGYRVAQQIGRPIANTYKAIETLAAKGAVVVDDDGEHRTCRAVAPDELFGRLSRSFGERCEAARQSLALLHEPAQDNRVYHLKSREQVISKARAMLEGARSSVLLDLFPGPLEALRGPIEAAGARGVRVAALLYAPAEVAGVRTVVAPWSEALEAWPGDQVIVVADAREHLVAVLERGWKASRQGGGVVQGLWSPSLLLSMAQHDGLVAQLIAHHLDALLARGADAAEIARERAQLRRYSVVHTPGYEQIAGAKRATPEPKNGLAGTLTPADAVEQKEQADE